MEEKSRTWEVISRRRSPWFERGERIGVYFLVTRAFNQRLFWMESYFCSNIFKGSKQEFWYSIPFWGVMEDYSCSFRFCLICTWSWLADGMTIWLTTLGGNRGEGSLLYAPGSIYGMQGGCLSLEWDENTLLRKPGPWKTHSILMSVFILFYVLGLS